MKEPAIHHQAELTAPGQERQALCGICPAGCWVIVTYDQEGKIAAVRADEGTPFGITCTLGVHSAEMVYSENRLR